jgi:hypothetical protein
VVVLEGAKETRYLPQDIDPAEPSERPTTGHGYNAFRGSDLWLDKSGAVHISVLGRDFAYGGGKWTPSGLTQETGSVVSSPPSRDDDEGLVPADDFSSAPAAPNGLFYREFHFFRRDKGGITQIDFGLNPPAHYPFEPQIFSAPLDPAGHIWTPGRYYSPDQPWYVSRAVAVPQATSPNAGAPTPR